MTTKNKLNILIVLIFRSSFNEKFSWIFKKELAGNSAMTQRILHSVEVALLMGTVSWLSCSTTNPASCLCFGKAEDGILHPCERSIRCYSFPAFHELSSVHDGHLRSEPVAAIPSLCSSPSPCNYVFQIKINKIKGIH